MDPNLQKLIDSIPSVLAQQEGQGWNFDGYLGMGNFALTIRVISPANQKFALKILMLDPNRPADLRQEMQKEAKILRNLRHPYIPTIYNYSVQSDFPWMLIEYFDGTPLKSLVNNGPLPINTWFRLASDLASALHAAHSKKIIHRDLHAGNVLIDQSGSAKLLDFGIANWRKGNRQIVADAELANTSLLTPEVIIGDEYSAASDIFTFGSLLGEAAKGISVWPNYQTNYQEFRNAIKRVQPDYTGISVEQRNIIQALHKASPNMRPTAEETLELIIENTPGFGGSNLGDLSIVKSTVERIQPKRVAKSKNTDEQSILPKDLQDAAKTISQITGISEHEAKKLLIATEMNFSRAMQLALETKHKASKPGPAARPAAKKVVAKKIDPKVVRASAIQKIQNRTGVSFGEAEAALTDSGGHSDFAIQNILNRRANELKKKSDPNKLEFFGCGGLLWMFITYGFGLLPWLHLRRSRFLSQLDYESRWKSLIFANFAFTPLGVLATFDFLGRLQNNENTRGFTKLSGKLALFACTQIFLLAGFSAQISQIPSTENRVAGIHDLIAGLCLAANLVVGIKLSNLYYEYRATGNVVTKPSKTKKQSVKLEKTKNLPALKAKAEIAKEPTGELELNNQLPFELSQATYAKEGSLSVPASSKSTEFPKNWDSVFEIVMKLSDTSEHREFTFELVGPNTQAIYFQGQNDGGFINIEASAEKVIKPSITEEVHRSLVKIGWEPPTVGIPNYVRFLDLVESKPEKVAELITTTIRDGYGLPIGSFGLQSIEI